MSSLYTWVQNYKKLSVVILGGFAVLLFWGIPMLISASFINERGILVRWQAGDFLQFYGAFLAFTGTTILGIVSWKQNQNIKNEMNILERNRILTENRPDLLVTLVTSSSLGWDKLTVGNVWDNKYALMQFEMDNIGNGIARTIKMYLIFEDTKYEIMYKANDLPDLINGFPPSKKIDINSMKRFIISIDCELVNFKDIITHGNDCALTFSFTDYYENKYEQNFSFIIENILYHGPDASISMNEDNSRKFGRCFDSLVIRAKGTSYPKLIETNRDFDKLYLVK